MAWRRDEANLIFRTARAVETRLSGRQALALMVLLLTAGGPFASAAEVTLRNKKHDPYGAPRPARDQQNTPLRTSFYCQLAVEEDGAKAGVNPGGKEAGEGRDEATFPDEVLPGSVWITLKPAEGESLAILEAGQRFAEGFRGRLFPATSRSGRTLEVYVDSLGELRPETEYTVNVSARARSGAELSVDAGTWRFTTEAAPRQHAVHFQLSARDPAVKWKGAFFSGFCKPSFCTSYSNRVPGYELMDQVRRSSPQAWSLQRDFWMTGMETGPGLLPGNLPNIVRERETRRVTRMEILPRATVLHVEDFFGHQQYGVAANRPLGGDYHPGDEVLIADGTSDARARVLSVDEQRKTVRVTVFETPASGWKIAYTAPLPKLENPDAPGLFPPGGCYLRKFKPSGDPVYYWGRLDREWDLAHRRFKRRLSPNFADAPGDLSLDGRSWTTCKDYAQLHAVVRAITGHLIDRYGDAVLEFPWSVFNEPDLGGHFWRSDWNELQRFYDYTVDGVLRAFEDRGYDSRQVVVGGLELGAIFGTHLRLREFLTHCSPRATGEGALDKNAAFADARLDGQRSQRVERLCRTNGGRGSPCDFISIHAYNTSQLMAAKLARGKQLALEIDAEFYDGLWVNSHECCPGWNMPPDPAFGDSYLGNGYFPTWCADVMRRRLQRAAEDPRYAYGETILTFWPWPNTGFDGGNACTRVFPTDDDGDGKADREVTAAMPILHFLGLTNAMPDNFWVLPERTLGAHTVSGFASRDADGFRLLAYAHAPLDTESRSEQSFEARVDLANLTGDQFEVTEYRFDGQHNSYFRLGRGERERRIDADRNISEPTKRRLRGAVQLVESGDKVAIFKGLDILSEIGPPAKSAAGFLFQLLQNTVDEEVRTRATETAFRISARQPYAGDIVRQVEELSRLKVTNRRTLTATGGVLELSLSVSANGANYVRIERLP